MSKTDHEILWDAYLAAERDGERRAAMHALGAFVEALRAAPAVARAAWASDFCRRVLDAAEPIPIRHPLFVGILVPFLKDGLATGQYPAARWMAGLAQHLYSNQAVWREFEFVTERGFLERALVFDPEDDAAKRRLFRVMWDEFRNATHAMPRGVLDGPDGASVAACGAMLDDLARLDALAEMLAEPPERRVQIARWQAQIAAYREHLSCPEEASFRALLAKRGLL
jgi:hypothetical protein